MRMVRGGTHRMIFQEPQSALNPVLTIGGRSARSWPPRRRRRRARVLELLEAVGMPDASGTITNILTSSRGDEERVMIPSPSRPGPASFIADEPARPGCHPPGADPGVAEGVAARAGMALHLHHHDLGGAEIADRVPSCRGPHRRTGARGAFFQSPRPSLYRASSSLPSEHGQEGQVLAVIPVACRRCGASFRLPLRLPLR